MQIIIKTIIFKDNKQIDTINKELFSNIKDKILINNISYIIQDKIYDYTRGVLIINVN